MYILVFPWSTYDSLATKWSHSQRLLAPSCTVDAHWTALSPSTVTAGHHCSVSMGPYSIFKGNSFGSSGQVVPGHTMPHFRGKAEGKSGEVGAHVPLLWTAHIWSRFGHQGQCSQICRLQAPMGMEGCHSPLYEGEN